MSLTEIWNWLGANVDAITSVAAIMAILFGIYVARKSPKWGYEAEYKITIIKEIFPELTSSIKGTLELYDSFKKGDANRFHKFSVLLDIIKTGQIEYIKIIDNTLYDSLMKIKSDILPLMDVIDSERNQLWQTLNEKWSSYLNGLGNIVLNTEWFSRELYQLQNYNIWNENYDDFLDTCHNILISFMNQEKTVRSPSDDQLMEMKQIAINEIQHIKRNIDPIDTQVNDIIINIVIPRLQKHIADPL